MPNLAPSVSTGSTGQAAPAAVDTSEKEIKERAEGPYAPAGLREAYDLPSESAGSGQTVGIVDAFNDPDAESDLAKYRSHFGLPPCTTENGCFRKVNQTGGTAWPNSTSSIWALEISLDVDMVSAVCPKCHILLVEATNDEYSNLAGAENEAVTLGATVVNDSWGGPEFPGETQYDSNFNHPGVPITVASGDTGGVVTYPAATPYVISVGGTVLQRANNARGWSETVWGGEGKEGAGSGCSAYEPKPAWQTDTGCTKRTDNDVAALAGGGGHGVWVADSYESRAYETYQGEDPGWTISGGTSSASALMSGVMALANEYTRSFPGAEALYRQAAQNGSGVLDDVISGHDGTCVTYLCEAIPGYDGPTGLGSPYGAPEVLPSFQQEPPQQEPQGSWVGKVGSAGYLLAGWAPGREHVAQDVSDLPNVSTTLAKGSRWQWAANTTDPRALQGPDGLTRNASTYYDPNSIQLRLHFSAAYTGNLHLYALDWDSTARREAVSVNLRTQALSSSFNQGAWLVFPVKVAAGESLTITVNRTAGSNAVLSGIFLGEAGAPPAPTVASAPQGGWVGKVGSEGYDLAGWDGPTGDVSYLPNAELMLGQGSRYQWATGTTDSRALSDPGQLTQKATTYYDPNELELTLSFNSAYKGNLHLYAVDWDHGGRREIVTVNSYCQVVESPCAENGQSVVLTEFSGGAWMSFPINVAAGGSVTITVYRTAGANAVLSGIFLGEAGAPPAPTVASAPQGGWVGKVGSQGYDLAGWDGPTGDVSYLPNESLSVLQGSRYQWASGSGDPRALYDPSGLVRNAGAYYDANQIRLKLTFPGRYEGTLHLYAVDWDYGGRREIITVNGRSAVLGEFGEGAWVSFPIKVGLLGGTVTITVDRTAGANAVLSGIFLGGEGAPPAMASTSAPQGSWVGTYGSVGYDLGGWSDESDLASMPSAAVSLAQGSRYAWASSTEDPRALQSPDKTTREAATYYDPNEIALKLSFASSYTGNLRLYAVDWDSTARRELISVNGQTAALSSSFNGGAWVNFPVSVAAGESVSIVVDRTAGSNAVLSGILLG